MVFINPAAPPLSTSRAGMAQRRFLAKKSAGGGKKKSGTPKKGPAAIKARGATPAPKAAGKYGSASGSSDVAAGRASAKLPTAAAAAGGGAGGAGGGGGGGFTKSEMLAVRKVRKASLNKKSAAAVAAATASEKAAVEAVTAAGSKGRAAGGAGARAQGKWGWGAKFLAGTSVGLAVLGIAWQLKPDEVRRLLDDSPVDHFAIWLMGKYALVRESQNRFCFLCAYYDRPVFVVVTVVKTLKADSSPS